MSQFPHDEFVKEYLPELYQDYGIVSPSADVMSEKREVDVLFTPTKPVPTTPDTLYEPNCPECVGVGNKATSIAGTKSPEIKPRCS